MTTMSKEAYAAIVGNLAGKRATVFLLFKMGEALPIQTNMTIREACEFLRWPHTTVSARIFELAETGLLKAQGARAGQTVWVASRPDEVEALRAARAAARKAKMDSNAKRLELLESAVKRVKDHKAELFDDGVEADLAVEGITRTADVFKAGYDECHRIMVELLTEAA